MLFRSLISLHFTYIMAYIPENVIELEISHLIPECPAVASATGMNEILGIVSFPSAWQMMSISSAPFPIQISPSWCQSESDTLWGFCARVAFGSGLGFRGTKDDTSVYHCI